MQDRKRNRPGTTLDHDPHPGGGEPVEEIRLPPHDSTKGRAIQDPKPRTKKRADDIETPESDDDQTGEMESAGQDLGVTVDEERVASSVEDSGTEDEESDWIDHDDDTDKGRGTFD